MTSSPCCRRTCPDTLPTTYPPHATWAWLLLHMLNTWHGAHLDLRAITVPRLVVKRRHRWRTREGAVNFSRTRPRVRHWGDEIRLPTRKAKARRPRFLTASYFGQKTRQAYFTRKVPWLTCCQTRKLHFFGQNYNLEKPQENAENGFSRGVSRATERFFFLQDRFRVARSHSDPRSRVYSPPI